MTSFSVLQDIIDRANVDPDHVAAKDLDRELSYAQLIDEVSRLAAGFTDRGVGEGDRVALLIPNSVDFIVAALASLWVGSVFVPLAFGDPSARLAAIVTDCAPNLIVTSTLHEPPSSHLCEDGIAVPMQTLLQEEGMPEPRRGEASRVAYMIYTSGTTATPKGVQIPNAAFAAAVRSTVAALGIGEVTITLCVSPFHFDGSYANLFPTLTSGGTVIIRPREALLFPRTFFSTVAKEKVTYSGFTPSYLRLLLASPQISSLGDSSLEMIALGGESISASDLRALWASAPRVRVFNRYGPTETTISVTSEELTPEVIDEDTIPIGRPHPGVTFALVNDLGRVIKGDNVAGELYIGGVQLMVGYWANPDLTRMVMRDDVMPRETMYRTGDLVYRDERGRYVYVDRMDGVVKRSGVRISLTELSASINMLDEVIAAVCTTYDRVGELAIVAFVVPREETTPLELRRSAGQLIPENMLPDRFELVGELPLNRSNQLDEFQLLTDAGLERHRPKAARPQGRAMIVM